VGIGIRIAGDDVFDPPANHFIDTEIVGQSAHRLDKIKHIGAESRLLPNNSLVRDSPLPERTSSKQSQSARIAGPPSNSYVEQREQSRNSGLDWVPQLGETAAPDAALPLPLKLLATSRPRKCTECVIVIASTTTSAAIREIFLRQIRRILFFSLGRFRWLRCWKA